MLGVVVAPDSVEAFADEMRKVKAALLEWKAKRQDKCEMIMFTVVSEPENHDALIAFLDKVYREEGELSPLLHALPVSVAVLNPRGKPLREYRLGQPVPAARIESKPWWKFW